MYPFFSFRTIAPLIAHSSPVSVSPILMLETSMAATGRSSMMGSRGIVCIVEGEHIPIIGVASSICSFIVWLRVWLGRRYLPFIFFMELRLSSMNVWGSSTCSRAGGKLYLGVVV